MNSWLWLLGFFGLYIMQEKTQHEEDYRKATMNPEQRLAYEKLSYIRYQDQQKRTKSFWGGVGIFFVLFVIGAASLILYSDHESNIQNQKDIEANQQRAIQESQENQRKWEAELQEKKHQEQQFLSLWGSQLHLRTTYSQMSPEGLHFFNTLRETKRCNEEFDYWGTDTGNSVPELICFVYSTKSSESFYRIIFLNNKIVSLYDSYSHKTIGHEPQ